MKIVFYSERDGNSEIYVMQAETLMARMRGG